MTFTKLHGISTEMWGFKLGVERREYTKRMDGPTSSDSWRIKISAVIKMELFWDKKPNLHIANYSPLRSITSISYALPPSPPPLPPPPLSLISTARSSIAVVVDVGDDDDGCDALMIGQVQRMTMRPPQVNSKALKLLGFWLKRDLELADPLTKRTLLVIG